ncbi:MAG TPA: alpha-glucan family phosphorylase, partial [Bacteroidia bacterium]|nr:alpha-glucan family phosphorylase [Bacteroidia bacterium]
DISIDALGKLNKEAGFNKDIIAFIFIPANQTGPRKDLLDHIGNNNPSAELKGDKVLTHYLQGADSDPILNRIKQNELYNNKENKVKIVFAPVYLDGKDGIFNIPYYDLLVGFDISAFPSYYEPWGYTPLESIAFHIPTITTNVTGFGIMLHSNDLNIGKGMSVIERTDTNDQEAADKIKSVVQEFSQKTPAEIESAREAASQLSKTALWKNYIINYKKAYDIALKKTEGRAKTFVHEGGIPFHKLETRELNKVSIPIWRELFVQSELPESLKTLNKLARNLWWTWNTEAQELFEACDKELWKSCDNNPIILLESLSYNKLQKLEKDKEFIERVNSVDKLFEEYMNRPFNKTPKVVYFCMEYGIYKHLKIYSGGLGILAGDYLKQASDSATNITGIGLLYKEGYFKQVISAHNEQMELEDTNTLTNLPIEHVYDANGNWLRISLAFPGRTLYAKVWKVNVGKVSLYLLDTDIPQNQAEDRLITARLYGGDTENRLKQELLLGIGGVRLIHKLDLKPEVYHYNEGHAAFAGLERLVTLVQGFNLSFDEAMEIVRASSLFTTHTAVPAGHDWFTEDILRVYLSFHANLLNISWKQLMGLGRANENDPAEKFSMSFLAARLSQDVNAVSKIHERVSKKLFRSLWESYSEEEINIGHVTNGVHYSSWVGSPWDKLYKGIFNDAQVSEQSHDSWKRINDISDAKIWEAHLECKKALLEEIKRRLKYEMNGLTGVKNAVQEKDILNEKTLIVGFARRFVTYKRPALLFNDLNRLADILQDKEKPVLFLYAGKSHPADKEAQELMKYVIEISKNARFEGHILYLQNYNTDLAKYLTQGVDLWLNTPEQDTEASGTSGMKAALNGVLNFSVLDGWWAEAYNEDIGWAIHSVQETNESHGANNVTDADELYQVLQHSIIPDFFAKEKDDYPEKWVNRMKKSIALIAPQFSMKRMLDEYTEKYYKKLSEKSTQIASNEWEGARKLTAWKNNVKAKWENLKVKNLEVFDSADRTLPLGTELTPRLTLDIQDFSADDISVEVVFTQKRNSNEEFGKIVLKKELVPASTKDNIVVYECKVPITKSGNFEYGFRISPKNNLLSYPHDFPLLKWV